MDMDIMEKGSFPLDLSCGFSPIFFIRAWEKKAAHIEKQAQGSQSSRACHPYNYVMSIYASPKRDLCQRRIKEHPMIAKHPDNPEILIDAGNPGLAFPQFVFCTSSQMVHEIPKNSIPFLQKEGDSVPRFAQEVSSPVRDGCPAPEFPGFVRHRIASSLSAFALLRWFTSRLFAKTKG
jgi:hypothetical protein